MKSKIENLLTSMGVNYHTLKITSFKTLDDGRLEIKGEFNKAAISVLERGYISQYEAVYNRQEDEFDTFVIVSERPEFGFTKW